MKNAGTGDNEAVIWKPCRHVSLTRHFGTETDDQREPQQEHRGMFQCRASPGNTHTQSQKYYFQKKELDEFVGRIRLPFYIKIKGKSLNYGGYPSIQDGFHPRAESKIFFNFLILYCVCEIIIIFMENIKKNM